MNQQEVADYLRAHPDFFVKNPSLITALSIPHSHQGNLSLVELQLNAQRQQIAKLTGLLEKFHLLAHQEADMFFALLPLQKRLFACTSLTELNRALNHWAQKYELEGAKILLFHDAFPENIDISPEYWLDRKAFELIRLERMGLRQCYLGGLSNKEKALLFLPEELPVGSLALMRLGGSPQRPAALLIFYARDTERFFNGQDTAFLRHIGDIVTLHLSDYAISP